MTFPLTSPPRLERDDLSDEEVCEDAEDNSDNEDDEAGAVGGARPKAKYVCADSSLKPSARLQLYNNQVWRMEVRLFDIRIGSMGV
jgi:hypothetical protein